MNALRKNIYFASDAHLGNRWLDDPLATEKKLVCWLDSIRDDAVAIYFLGDMFDYWYEYKYVVPRGHVRFLGKLAELADLGIEIHLLIGNHDIWMFDYLPRETGVKIHQGPLIINLLGQQFLLAHGDEVGHRPAGFRFLRALFRNRFCQFLYAGIHPRWTFAFARRWSLSSRRSGTDDHVSQERRIDYLADFATACLHEHPDIRYFIFGHLHVALDRPIAGGAARMLIAGDWMQQFSYIQWDGQEVVLKQYMK